MEENNFEARIVKPGKQKLTRVVKIVFFLGVERQRFYYPETFYEIIIQGHTTAKQNEYKNEEDMKCKRLVSKRLFRLGLPLLLSG